MVMSAFQSQLSRFREKMKNYTKKRGPYTYKPPEEVGDGWPISDISGNNMDVKKIHQAVDNIHGGTYQNIFSILIVKNGKLILEEYFPAKNQGDRYLLAGITDYYGRDRLYPVRSVTKSINSVLLGIAVDQVGGIDVKCELFNFLPAYAGYFEEKNKKSITLEHALTMTTGFKKEPGGFYNNMVSSFDSIKTVLERPLQYRPGENFEYSNGTAHVLGRIVARLASLEPDKFAEKYLFGPLNIRNFKWNKSFDGNTNTCSGLMLRPRDMAKIGFLFLNKGRWDKRQIVPAYWIEESTRGRVNSGKKGSTIYSNSYGYQWWVSPFYVGRKKIDSFSAQGEGGQLIFCFPTLDMVVVFTAGNMDSRNMSQPFDILEKYIIPAVFYGESARIKMKDKNCIFPVIAAARKGELTVLKYLGENGFNMNEKTRSGENALIYSALEGNPDVVKFLIGSGLNMDVPTRYGYSAMHWAALNGHTEIIRYFILHGADINVKDNEGHTPFLNAVRGGHPDTVKLLIEKGSAVDIKDNSNNTALMHAVWSENHGIVEFLLEKGIEIEAVNNADFTALMSAVVTGDLESVKLLIAYGAGVDTRNRQGHTALMCAAYTGEINMVKYLIEKDASVNGRDYSLNTALVHGLKRLDIVRYLVDKNAEINVKNKYGYTPLMLAFEDGNRDVLEFLIDKGADINSKEFHSKSLLVEAVKRKDVELVKLLTGKGANINISDESGYSPAMWAEVLECSEMLLLLRQAGAAEIKKKIPDEQLKVLQFDIREGALDKDSSGYKLTSSGVSWSTAIKRTEIEYTKNVVFKLKLKTSSRAGLSNGFFLFGDDTDREQIIGCGVFFTDGGYMSIRNLYSEFNQKKGNFDKKKILDLVVRVDIKKRKITMTVNEKEKLKVILPENIRSVTHFGYSCSATRTYFSEVEISGK